MLVGNILIVKVVTEVSLFEFSDCRITEETMNEEMRIGIQNGEICKYIEEDIGVLSCRMYE